MSQPTDMYTNLPNRALQFATRKDATLAAVSLGWRRSDVSEIAVMGFRLWGVSDDHMRLLTKAGYDFLLGERRASLSV